MKYDNLPSWWKSDKPWIIQDCLEGMKSIPDKAVDLVLTSPPYDDLRDYGGFTFDYHQVIPEIFRIMKDDGVCVWIVGDKTENGTESCTSFKQVLAFRDIGFNLHDTMIYEKAGFASPSTNRYHQVFEFMFIFSKGNNITFNPLKDRPNKWESWGRNTRRQKDGRLIERPKRRPSNPTGMRMNIWRYSTGFGNTSDSPLAFQHPAAFLDELAHDHIISWSIPGDIVLDPFLGSGTTLLACRKTGRIGLGFEINPEYESIIRERSMAEIPKIDEWATDKDYEELKETAKN